MPDEIQNASNGTYSLGTFLTETGYSIALFVIIEWNDKSYSKNKF